MHTYDTLLEEHPDAPYGASVFDVRDLVDGTAEITHAIVGKPETFIGYTLGPSVRYRLGAWWRVTRHRIFERSPAPEILC
jgi:hypothetical protein